MRGIVDWAADRARMVVAFIILSITAGVVAYVNLPKEGEPDIDIPALFVSVPFAGISAEDSERILVRTMETELADLDGLDSMTSTAAEGYAGVMLEFDFGWDKGAVIADVRDAMNTAEANFPAGADGYMVHEINFSEFPIVVVNLTGPVPERTLVRLANDLQDKLESIDAVLKAELAGYRDEMLEVVIDPLKLEAYNVTAGELIAVVQNNNQLIAAGEIKTEQGANAVKIPASFDDVTDIYSLPVKVNGDSVVTLGDLARIRLTFEDRAGTARFNGENTVALQVVKRKGFNLIDTAALVRDTVEQARLDWPEELRQAVRVGTSNDQSYIVDSMVKQLEGSVITAIALVMIVVLASLGIRSALLVGFAIPTSFLLTFALFGALGVTVSNIVMFGLILAVGMLVDGAIVVVEYADKKMKEGVGPMHAFTMAAKRMFWPIVSSTATTLCAFLPMLFWPGIPGEFMGWLPKTLIFVLSASLLVALVYLPVMGGVSGRISRLFHGISELLRPLPWLVRAVLVLPAGYLVFLSAMQMINTDYLFPNPLPGGWAILPGAILFLIGAVALTITLDAAKIERPAKRIRAGYRRNAFGWIIHLIVGNPIMPLVTIGAVGFFVMSTFAFYGENNKGVEFFTDSEPEQAIIYIRARGNLSLAEKDEMLRQAEDVARGIPGIRSIFSFAGEGGLNQNTGGAASPRDTVGQLQIELVPWRDRPREVYDAPLFGVIPFQRTRIDPTFGGNAVIEQLKAGLAAIPAMRFEVLALEGGPASSKPVHLRLKGDDWDSLRAATRLAEAQFQATPGLRAIEDTLPLPGFDWELDVNVEKAGRYGTDVMTVGGMVQLVTTGLLLDTMRVDSSDEEIEIRVRLPEKDRVLSTLDTLKLRTAEGLVPLSNFVTRKPVPSLAQIDRYEQTRYYDVKAAVETGLLSMQQDNQGETEEDEITRYAVVSLLDEEDLANGAKPDLVATTPPSFLASLFGAEPEVSNYSLYAIVGDQTQIELQSMLDAETADQIDFVPVTDNERIDTLEAWLQSGVLPDGVSYEWTGDREEQAESMAFLGQAFIGALFLMFIILLAQFNSLYNSVLVLLAVVLSTAGVLVGMLVMDQAFSIIMTGTGIVALAGIVVNNNIVLIDTYQDYSRYMPSLEAITRTAEARIRPVLLTTITTMAGLAPMMFGLSLDFFNGGYSIDSPTALWWKQLATAVVFGLGIATVLTLVFTPSMLALRIWMVRGAYGSVMAIRAGSWTREGKRLRAEWAQQRAARKIKTPELIWDEEGQPLLERAPVPPALPEPEAVEPDEKGAPAPQDPSPDNTDSRPSGGPTGKGSTDAAE